MGFCKKSQIDGGIPLRTPLRAINTNNKIMEKEEAAAADSEESGSTTPTSVEARIPQRLPCPLAPRKRRPSLKYPHFNGVKKDFFNPPELESVFKRSSS